MNLSRYKARSWIGGTLLALAGVAVSRLVAPSVPDEKMRALVAAAGQIVAIAGLFWIALGIHRRIKRDNQDGAV